MNYSILAGCLVTLSFFFLMIEVKQSKPEAIVNFVFLVVYAVGVIFWLILGVLMDNVALVAISALQLFFMLLIHSFQGKKNEK